MADFFLGQDPEWLARQVLAALAARLARLQTVDEYNKDLEPHSYERERLVALVSVLIEKGADAFSQFSETDWKEVEDFLKLERFNYDPPLETEFEVAYANMCDQRRRRFPEKK